MLDKLLPRELSERLVVLLEVGLRGLRTSSDGHSDVLVVVARGACLEQVCTCLVNGADQQTNSEGSLCGVEGLDLRLLGDLADQSLSGMMAVMSVPVVEALASHELAEETSISGEASNGDTHVIIDIEHLLLVACQVMRALLERDENL